MRAGLSLLKHRENGSCEMVRYSETLSRQTFYYAVRLDNGEILRVARTTDSVFQDAFFRHTDPGG